MTSIIKLAAHAKPQFGAKPEPQKLYIDVRALSARLSLHRATIYRMIGNPQSDFPKPRKFGAKASRWSLREIEEWEARQ